MRMVRFTKDSIISRNLFPHEQDEYIICWWESFFKSRLSLLFCGIGLIVLSRIGFELFKALDPILKTIDYQNKENVMEIAKKLSIILSTSGSIAVVLGFRNLIHK